MASNETSPWRPFWLFVLGAALIWLVWRLSAIILPFVLAGLAAYLLNPVIDRLEEKGWSRNLAIGAVMLGLLAIGLAIVALLVPPLISEVASLIDSYPQLQQQAQELLNGWQARLQALFPSFHPGGSLAQELQARVADAAKWLLQHTPGFLARSLQGIVSFIILLVLTAILTFWMLKEYHSFGERLLLLIPRRYASSMPLLSRKISQIVRAYLIGLLILCSLAAAAAIIVLLLFRVQYGYLLGLLVGVGYAIPYFGYPIATAIILIVSAITGQGGPALLGILGCLLAINFLLDYVVTPRIMGERVGLHPMTIIFAVLALGELFGFIGILISMPLAAALRVSLAVFFPELFRPRAKAAAAPAPPAQTPEA